MMHRNISTLIGANAPPKGIRTNAKKLSLFCKFEKTYAVPERPQRGRRFSGRPVSKVTVGWALPTMPIRQGSRWNMVGKAHPTRTNLPLEVRHRL
jgi:hypothetical protein